MTTNYPDAVVAVVGSKAINGYPYEVAVVYHLATRKRDGELIYRKSDVNYARPRRSHRLAVLDAQHVSEDLGFPFWEGTRHGMTADHAYHLHVEKQELDEALRKPFPL